MMRDDTDTFGMGMSGAEIAGEWLTVEQAAEITGVTAFTIVGWIRSGHLPMTRIARRRAIRPADLTAAYTLLYLDGIVPVWRQDCQRCGLRLRALREAAGLSQQDLAAVCGLTHEAISRLETGFNAPYAETVRTLAQALRVAPDEFVRAEPIGLSELSAGEVARRLGIPVKRARRWVREGALPGRKVSGQWRVPAVAVRELGGSGRLRGQSLRLDPRYRG
jgi:excisionase family DNA binding protein